MSGGRGSSSSNDFIAGRPGAPGSAALAAGGRPKPQQHARREAGDAAGDADATGRNTRRMGKQVWQLHVCVQSSVVGSEHWNCELSSPGAGGSRCSCSGGRRRRRLGTFSLPHLPFHLISSARPLSPSSSLSLAPPPLRHLFSSSPFSSSSITSSSCRSSLRRLCLCLSTSLRLLLTPSSSPRCRAAPSNLRRPELSHSPLLLLQLSVCSPAIRLSFR